MGLFDKFKKNSEPAGEPLKSTAEKEPSVVAAVPLKGGFPTTAEEFSAKLSAASFVTVVSRNERDSGETEFIQQINVDLLKNY